MDFFVFVALALFLLFSGFLCGDDISLWGIFWGWLWGWGGDYVLLSFRRALC